MIPRYSMPEMAALWTDEARLSAWLEVEVLAVEAWARLGVVPDADAVAVRARSPQVTAGTVRAVAEREAVTDHDVAAFVDVVQAAIGPPEGNWVHYGLTSSDVVDTALGVTLAQAADLLVEASDGLVASLKRRALEFRDAPMAGRTHGIHAEPTTFGAKLALWCLQADRDRARLRAARQTVAVGKLSGAVGTYSNVHPDVEAHVCEALGLRPVPSTQVVARDRHAELAQAVALAGAGLERYATEVRHLQRTEVREVEEPFRAGQKGSSAMPHKRNPIVSERITGIARLLRGYAQASTENVALWHERDISHSSVERVTLPDATILIDYGQSLALRLVTGMTVRTDRMLANLEATHGALYSQRALLALVETGRTRDEAYRIVQEQAQRAWDSGTHFRELLTAAAPELDLDAIFDPSAFVRHAREIVGRLDALEPVAANRAPAPA